MERRLKGTIDNFFTNTIGLWKRCNRPKRKPDYTSYRRSFALFYANTDPLNCLGDKQIYYKHHFIDHDGDLRVYYEDKQKGISSRYWYGEDSKGKYIIRESDHWGDVASCTWGITKPRKKDSYLIYGKIYLK